MRRASDLLIAGALLGVAVVACSSDDSSPPVSDSNPRTNVEANAPSAMNAANGSASEATDPGMGASGAAPGESPAGAGSPEAPAEAAPSGESEGMPGDLGLNPGAGGSGNAGGADADDSGDDGAGGEGGDADQAGDDGEGDAAGGTEMGEPTSELGVFVATPSDSGGDLGGLAGADATCQALAEEVGAGDRTWRAYLSTSTVDARDRIGEGPWVNASGIVVATDLDDLHSLSGAGGTPLVDLFVDHEGSRVNGQWAGSPGPNQHDVLTGSAADGTALAATCNDWTSSTATPGPQVGHSDGLGPGMNPNGNFGSWNSSHAPQGCSQQQLIAVGGAGRFYCFAAD